MTCAVCCATGRSTRRRRAMRQLQHMTNQARPRVSSHVSIQTIIEREGGSDLVPIVPGVKSVTFEVDVAIWLLAATRVKWVCRMAVGVPEAGSKDSTYPPGHAPRPPWQGQRRCAGHEKR